MESDQQFKRRMAKAMGDAFLAVLGGMATGLLFAGIVFAATEFAWPQQPQPPASAADQWYFKAQSDMNALTSTLNLGLTAVNSDMDHLRQELAATEQAAAKLQAQVKQLQDEKAAADKSAGQKQKHKPEAKAGPGVKTPPP